MRPVPDDPDDHEATDDHDQDRPEAGEHAAPICACGVTAMPAETEAAAGIAFVCENPDCEAFGTEIA